MKKTVLTLVAAAMMCSLGTTAQNKVKNIYTEGKALNLEQVQNTDEPTQLNRYLMAGYNTLCVPMSVDAKQLAASGITLERLAAIHQEGNTLQLLFVDCTEAGIEAGVPYLVYSPKTQYLRLKNTEATAIDTQLNTVRLNDGQGNQVAFSSSWMQRQKEGLYGIPARQAVKPLESVLVRTTSELAFLPTRCGFYWEEQAASATELQIVHATAAEVTSILQLNVNADIVQTAYDLQGRKHPTLTKGVNIVNGKKVVK